MGLAFRELLAEVAPEPNAPEEPNVADVTFRLYGVLSEPVIPATSRALFFLGFLADQQLKTIDLQKSLKRFLLE